MTRELYFSIDAMSDFTLNLIIHSGIIHYVIMLSGVILSVVWLIVVVPSA
jgi:hypothetical protein